MATYREIQEWVKRNYGFTPKTCWIADVKSQCGLPMRKAPNRQGTKRKYPCPKGKVKQIKAAFRHFGMI
mgnify:CR=1 FL=1